MKIHNYLLAAAGVLALVVGIWMVVQSIRYEAHVETKAKAATAARIYGPRGPADETAVARANLRSLLGQLQDAGPSPRRERFLEMATARREVFEAPLMQIIEEPDRRLLLPAIAVVREWKLAAAVVPLTFLAKGGEGATVAAASVRAVDAIQPFEVEALVRLLRSPESQVLEAALDALARRESVPVENVVPLLGHEKAAVRRAAAAALPVLEDGPELEIVCAMARQSKGATARACAQALAETGVPIGAERCLLELVARPDWSVRMAALDALARKRSPLRDAGPLLHLVRDSQRPLKERVRALVVLEQTGTPLDEAFRGSISTLHPVLRMHGARCLVRARDLEGVVLLADLLTTKESMQVSEEESEYVRGESRALLFQLAGEDRGGKVAAWRKWARGLERFPNQVPSSPPPSFW